MANNTPAFQYYPADLISDPDVMFWDMETVGCYWQMITFLWLNGGEFEFNLENLRKLFRVKRRKKAQLLWEKIKIKFVLENNIVIHKRVVKEMQKQEKSRLKRSNAGRKGMDSRWKKDNNVIGSLITKNNSSTSTSTSSSTSVNKTPKPPKGADDVVKESFERFWAIWPKHFRKVDKSNCLKKWQAKKLHLDKRIIPALEKFKISEQWIKDDGQFIPGPHKWLHREFYIVDLESIKLPSPPEQMKTGVDRVLEEMAQKRKMEEKI